MMMRTATRTKGDQDMRKKTRRTDTKKAITGCMGTIRLPVPRRLFCGAAAHQATDPSSGVPVNAIIQGDALAILRAFPADSINLVVTSPPYFGLRRYGDETLGRETHPQAYLDNLRTFFVELQRVLHPAGSFYLNVGDVYYGRTKKFGFKYPHHFRRNHAHFDGNIVMESDGGWLRPKQLLGIPQRIVPILQGDGWILRNDIIWEKPAANPVYGRDRRLPVYEHIIHVVKSDKYFFDFPTAKQMHHHRDVIRCNIKPFGDHPASFPEDLVEPLILTTSRPNDIVLDPFCGSGTVPVVCARNSRRYIGMELNPRYCEIAEKRMGDARMKLAA